jgi:hypothetical protein
VRRTVPIILLVLGAACAVIGVGRLTFWGPEKTLSVQTKTLDAKAPLTLVTQPVRELSGDGAKLTVHSKGSFRAMVGRAEDVDAWAGDAATTVVSGVDEDKGKFLVQERPGSSTSPNPAGSDLWVVDSKHKGDWTASWSSEKTSDENTWTPPADGKWTLLLATDGKHPAPANLSLTWDNPDATWAAKFSKALWWFIAAMVLIIASLVFFTRKPRRSSGRRAAVPSAGSRGAARETPRRAARSEPQEAAAPWIATVEEPEQGAQTVQQANARATGEDTSADDETVIGPLDLTEAGQAPEDEQRSDDDFDLPGGPAEEGDGRRGGKARNWRRGAAVGLTATALALPGSQAWGAAAHTVTPASTVSQAADDSEKTTYPVMVESQLKRIMTDVAAAQSKGDKSRKASDLGERFQGAALNLRKSYYAHYDKGVKDNTAVPVISAGPIKASAVTTTSRWPREAMVVTQGQNQPYPVIVTLEQKSPRSNYAAVQAVPMVAEAKLPGVTLGSPEVVTQSADQKGLVTTPAQAVDGFADLLKNSKSKWASKFDDSVFVDVWHQNVTKFTKALKKADPKASFSTSFSVDSGATNVLASPQGGSYVSGDVTITTVAKPSDGGTLSLPGDAGKLTGKKDTTKNVVTTYHVPVFLYIPPSGDGKVRIVGATQQVADIDLK